MHWLDIIILIVLAIGAAMGFWSGLLWQIARVVSLAVSLYFAVVANSDVAEWITDQWKDLDTAASRIIAFVGIFIVVYLTLYLITRLIHQAIEATQLKTVDRLLGALLGAAKMGVIVACVCALMVAMALPTVQDWFEHSTLAPHFARGTETVVSWVPQSSRDRIDDAVSHARGQLQQKLVDAAGDALKK
jgi:membrane protein required for colicin V production